MDRIDRDRRIDYVEFPAADLARTRAFYAAAFGWTFTEYGPDYLAFSDGALDGGFARAPAVTPAPGGALVILYATDLEAARAAVVAAGGRIVTEPFDFPGGRRFHFADPDGHELGVWSEAAAT